VLLVPGNGRPAAVRAVVILMGALAFVPVGMLLTFAGKGVYRVRRGLLSVTGLGLLLTGVLYAFSTLVMSAFPAMPAILYRTAGIVVGAAAISWLVRQDGDALRQRLAGLLPWAVVPYLMAVLLVNRLLSVHWLTWAQAVAQAYPLGFLPLFDYYIVTKAEAAKNIVGHAVLYMPVGILLWLRYGEPCVRPAFGVAALLSLLVEVARYFRPELEGDPNAVVVGGLAAALAARMMPAVWSMLQELGRQSGVKTKRRWGGARLGPEVLAAPAAEIEHY
jgi:hypothetical protein